MSDERKKLTGSDILVQVIAEMGVDYVFSYPGGAVLPIFDAYYRAGAPFKNILCRHEQGLIHAAEGYARVTGRAGVVLATSGPGGTNLITGIADAMIDSLPIVAFTGQVGKGVLGTDAFQEADMIGLTTPITKHNYQLQDAREIPQVVRAAFHIATTGRKGPVVIDMPKSVSEQVVYEDEIFTEDIPLPGYQPTYTPHQKQIRRLIDTIEEAKRPVILAGAGVACANASELLVEFAERYQIPVTSTFLGLGAFPISHELSLGMAGMHGTYASNMAIQESDLLINIGSRFDDRITGNVSKFAPDAKVAHIDIDPAEIGKIVDTQVPIVGDAKEALAMLLESDIQTQDYREWTQHCLQNKADHPLWYCNYDDLVSPQWFIEKVSQYTDEDAVVVTDVGQHQMWAGQFYEYNQPRRLVSSGGLGTMGFGLPAAIGAQVGHQDGQVVAIVGDGGVQMTIQELAVLKEYNLPVKLFILNNEALGMVRQWQELLYEERYSESLLDQGRNPDFVKLAEGYGIKACRIRYESEVDDLLEEVFSHDGPVLVDVRIPQGELVYPMVPAGKGNHEMLGVDPLCEE